MGLFNIVGGAGRYAVEDFRQVMGARIIQPLTDFFAESKYTYTDIDAKREELAQGIAAKLKRDFAVLGFEIKDFRIEGTSFDDDTMRRINRIADMTAEAQAAQAVGVNYAQVQQLEAMREAARNPGGAAGAGLGLGAGIGMGQMMAGMMQMNQPQQAQPPANDPMAKLQKLQQMLDGGLITAAEYDAKKKEILSRM
ncbi:MAG: SPFH domain-containing protein [Planctomycetota bacterium]